MSVILYLASGDATADLVIVERNFIAQSVSESHLVIG